MKLDEKWKKKNWLIRSLNKGSKQIIAFEKKVAMLQITFQEITSPDTKENSWQSSANFNKQLNEHS